MTTKKAFQETPREKFERIKRAAVKQLTTGAFINPDGELDLFWGEGDEMRHSHFREVDTAISQCIHVLDRLRGSLERIWGKTVSIPGETQRMRKLAAQLQQVVARFMSEEPLTAVALKATLEDLEGMILELQRASAPEKKQALQDLLRLKQNSLVDERGEKKPGVAVQASKAVTSLARRYEDVVRKVKGTIIRLQKLLKEKYEAERIMVNVRRRLGSFLKQFEDDKIPDDNTLKRMAHVVAGGRANLVIGLGSILVNPYFRRTQLPPIQRLSRAEQHLARYLETHSPTALKTFYNTLKLGYETLSRPHREWQARRRKKPSIDEEGRVRL